MQKAQKIVPVPTLRFEDGPRRGERLRLEADVGTIGRREDNTYVVDDPRVSRVHAELRRDGDRLILTDLGSSGGTHVNGEEVTGSTVLHHGDDIRFGPVRVQVEDPATAAGEEGDLTVVFDVPEVASGPHLSPRQQEVLEGMAEGLTNAQIGENLGVTERTVKAYAQELYDRLGVRNRAGAVSQGVKHGLL